MPRSVRRPALVQTGSWAYATTAVAMLGLALIVTAAYLDRARDPLLASAMPSAPVRAVVALPSGAGLPNGSWANTGDLRLRVTIAGNADDRTVVPEFEILPANIRFTGVANAAGTLSTLRADGLSVVSFPVSGLLNDRQYHWRVRTRSLDGSTSKWVGGGFFGISVTPPTSPELASANAPAGATTNLPTISLHWNPSIDRTGIAYYQWANSLDPQAVPTWHSTRARELHLHTLGDGTWYISIRAVNRAGVVSDPLRFSVRIDRSAPELEGLFASTYDLSVGAAPAHVQFSLSRAGSATLEIMRANGSPLSEHVALGTLSPGTHDVAWDGRDAVGGFLPSGTYKISIAVRDALGNSARHELPGLFTLDTRRVVVSLTKQDMAVYDGSKLLVHTLITSGGPETQTPVGAFHVIAKYSPYVMRSPWPKSSRLWYPTSTVSYAILFRAGGFFLHDAPWRTLYGPGSNAVDGIPGGSTTGTHGCVNVPLGVEEWLYQWVHVGTTVQIRP